MNIPDKHVVSIKLSDEDIKTLVTIVDDNYSPANDVIKRIIYQANNSPIFCSAFNRPIKHLYPKLKACQPFPTVCLSCPLGIYEE